MATTKDTTQAASYTINDVVKDVQIIPYIRSRTVEFVATKMKPNTRVYAFFDGQAVSQHCRDTGFQLTSGNASTATQLVAYGSPLITDAKGQIRGEFRIPEGQFFTGSRQFILTDDPTMSGDPDMESTKASAVYFAGGIRTTTQTTTLNVVTPVQAPVQVPPARIEPIQTPSSSNPTQPVPPPGPSQDCLNNLRRWHPKNFYQICLCMANGGSAGACGDPVAQAFISLEDTFVTSLDVFFKQVDMKADRIFVQIRNMENGYPGTDVISMKYYLPEEIDPYVSADSTTPFKVVFDAPIYIQGGVQYCFVIGGNSPDTQVWVAQTGKPVVNNPDQIVQKQTTSEPSFRSQNGTTWNAEQTEQIKFNLYTAVFSSGPLNLVFENDPADAQSVILDENPFQMQTGQTRIRVFSKNHGLTSGDRVSMSLFDDKTLTLTATDFAPQVEQFLHTVTGSGYVTSVTPTGQVKEYTVTLKNVSGNIITGQTYTCDATTKNVRDPALAQMLGSSKPNSISLNQCSGTVTTSTYTSKYPGGTIAGIPVAEFNTEWVSSSPGLSVIEITDEDSFIINSSTPATATGRFGGENVTIYNKNIRYDIFNVSGIYLPYSSLQSWTYNGIGHGDTGSIFESSNYKDMGGVKFSTSTDTFLTQPYKLASKPNEQIQLGAGKSIEIESSFKSSDRKISPVVNLDTFSVTTITNRIQHQDTAKLAAIPTVEGSPIYYPEESVVLGTEMYKYVTKTVNLKNAANDLQLYVDVYKDINADFDIYFKLLPVYASGSIEEQPWIKANAIVKNYNSSDVNDMIEYKVIGSQNCTPYVSNTISYTGWPNEPFVAFKVKIVGSTLNSSKPPLFQKLRVVAVT